MSGYETAQDRKPARALGLSAVFRFGRSSQPAIIEQWDDIVRDTAILDRVDGTLMHKMILNETLLDSGIILDGTILHSQSDYSVLFYNLMKSLNDFLLPNVNIYKLLNGNGLPCTLYYFK